MGNDFSKSTLHNMSTQALNQRTEAAINSWDPDVLSHFNYGAPFNRFSGARLTQLATASMKSPNPDALFHFNDNAPLYRLSDDMLTQLATASMKSPSALSSFNSNAPLDRLSGAMLTQLVEAASRYGHTTLNKSLDKISPASWKKHAENALSSNKLATFFSYAPLDKISPADWEELAKDALNNEQFTTFVSTAPLGRLSDGMLTQLAEASLKSSNPDALFRFNDNAPLDRLSDAMLTQLATASLKSSAHENALSYFNEHAPLGRLSDDMLTQLAEASMKSSAHEHALGHFNWKAPLDRLSGAMLTQLATASMKSSDPDALRTFNDNAPLGRLSDDMLTQLATASMKSSHSEALRTFNDNAPLGRLSDDMLTQLATASMKSSHSEALPNFINKAPLDRFSDGMLTQLAEASVKSSNKDALPNFNKALIRCGFDESATRSIWAQHAAKSLSVRNNDGSAADKPFYDLLQKTLTAPEKTILLKAAIAETGKRDPKDTLSRTAPLFAFLAKNPVTDLPKEAKQALSRVDVSSLHLTRSVEMQLKEIVRTAKNPLPSAPPLPTVPEHANFAPSAPPAPVGTAIWATSPPASQGSFHHTPPAKQSFFQKMKAKLKKKLKKKPAVPAPAAQTAYPPSVISDPSEPRPFHTTSGAAQGFCMATERANTEAQYETEIGDIAFYAESRGAQSFQKLGGIISSVEHTLSELYRDHQGLAMGLAVDHNRHSFTAVILQAVAQAVAGAANSIPVVGGAVAAGAAQAGQAVHAKDHAVQARKFEKFGVFGLVNDHNQRNVFSPDAQQDNARAVFHEVACCLGLELADQLKTGKTQQIGGVLNEGKQYAERIVTAILNADQNTLDGMKSVADLSLFVLEKALSNPVTAWNNQPAIRERAVKLYKKYIEKGKVPFCEYSRTDTGHSVRGGNIRLASLRTRPSTVLNANQNISPLSSPRYGAGSSRMPVV